MYETQNPIKLVFKSLTESEYQRVLAQLLDDGKQAVSQASQLYQHFGAQIGASANDSRDIFPKALAFGIAPA